MLKYSHLKRYFLRDHSVCKIFVHFILNFVLLKMFPIFSANFLLILSKIFEIFVSIFLKFPSNFPLRPQRISHNSLFHSVKKFVMENKKVTFRYIFLLGSSFPGKFLATPLMRKKTKLKNGMGNAERILEYACAFECKGYKGIYIYIYIEKVSNGGGGKGKGRGRGGGTEFVILRAKITTKSHC